MKLAFFDTKPYDIPGFDRYGVPAGIEIKYFESGLNPDTVSLAAGFDAVCVFVNDIVSAEVVDKLHRLGVKAILLRCAGSPPRCLSCGRAWACGRVGRTGCGSQAQLPRGMRHLCSWTGD